MRAHDVVVSNVVNREGAGSQLHARGHPGRSRSRGVWQERTPRLGVAGSASAGAPRPPVPAATGAAPPPRRAAGRDRAAAQPAFPPALAFRRGAAERDQTGARQAAGAWQVPSVPRAAGPPGNAPAGCRCSCGEPAARPSRSPPAGGSGRASAGRRAPAPGPGLAGLSPACAALLAVGVCGKGRS